MTDSQPTIFATYRFDDHDRTVMIEDDGRVCYGYLLNGDHKIIGDVWLYNRCTSPAMPEWTSPDNAPYANPVAYAEAFDISQLPTSEADFSARATVTPDGRPGFAIHIGSQLHAILADGRKPGWSRLARQDGPLALKLAPPALH